MLFWSGRSEGAPGGRPPDGPLMLGGLQQASVVGHDLVLRQVQVELQRHQDGELKGNQLTAVHSEALLQFLREESKRGALRYRGRYAQFSSSLMSVA